RNLSPKNAVQEIMKASELWKFLDEFKPTLEYRFVSDHADEPLQPHRGYGRAKKPEDYIESFRRYIDENRNRITALNLICSRPAALDRKSLKELYLQLDHEGFTDLNLRHAWKAVKNE